MTVPRLMRVNALASSFTGPVWPFVGGMGASNQVRWQGAAADPLSPSDVTDQSFELTVKFVGVKLQDIAAGGTVRLLSTLNFAPFGGVNLGTGPGSSGAPGAGFLALGPSFTYGAFAELSLAQDVPILAPFVVHAAYSSGGVDLYWNGRRINRFYPEAQLGDYSVGAPLSISSSFQTYNQGFSAASLLVGTALTPEQIVDDFVATVPSSPHLASATHAYSAAGLSAPTDDLVDSAGSYDLSFASNGGGAPLTLGLSPAADSFQVLLREITQASATQLDHTVLSTGNATYWWVMTQNVGEPSVAQMKAGRDSTNALAPASDMQALTALAASPTQSATGLTTGEAYWLYGYAEATDARTVGPLFLGVRTAGVGALGAFDNSFDDSFLKA